MSFLPGRKGLEELGTDFSKLIWAWILQGFLPKARASPGVMVSVLWVSASLDWSGFGAGGDGRCLSLPIVPEALPAWNTMRGKFPDREICRLQSPRGRPGLGLSRAAAGRRGWVSASRAGGRQPAFPVVREPAPHASSADSFLSRAGGPCDRSPLGGLGGERPKAGGRAGGVPRRYLVWPGEWETEHQIFLC